MARSSSVTAARIPGTCISSQMQMPVAITAERL